MFPEWAGSAGCPWLVTSGGSYALTADGTVGFVDTMDPGRGAGVLLPLMTGLLVNDQDIGRARA